MRAIRGLLLAVASSAVVLTGCGSGSSSSRTQEPALPDGVTIHKNRPGDTIQLDSEYILINNEWNAAAASPPYSETVFTGDSDGIPFFGWSWSWNNSNRWTVLTYPEVLYGQSPWSPAGFHSAGFIPVTVGGHTVQSSFDISLLTSPVSAFDTYDVAYDIWILKATANPASFSASDIKCELMIWLDTKNAIPDGLSPSDSLTANGNNFGFYYNPNQSSGTSYQWIYAAFSSPSPILHSTDFDITPFLTYLTDHGVLSTSDYVASIELGIEVAIGAGQMVIRDYSVTVGP